MNESASSSQPLIAQILIDIEGQIDRSKNDASAIVQRSEPLPVAVEVAIEDRYEAEGWTFVEFTETPRSFSSPPSGYQYKLKLRR